MHQYITVSDVDDMLPAGWEGDGDKERAVLEANVWLEARGVETTEPTPDAVKQAGAYLAKDAADGALYGDTEPALKRKKVVADTVESEKEFMDGATAQSGTLILVYDLLRPFLPVGGGANFDVRRV